MKDNVPNQDEILQVLQAHAPRAMHVGELCGRLNVPRSAKDELIRRLLVLAEDNLVGEMPGPGQLDGRDPRDARRPRKRPGLGSGPRGNRQLLT
jgi:hypothetical protein